MRVKSVEARPFYVSFADIWGGEENVPDSIRRPAAHFKKIPRSGQYSTIIIVESEDGVVGLGESFGLPYSPVTTELINAIIAPGLVGQELDDPADLLADFRTYFVSMGHTRGFSMEALAGIDIALWDLKAKAAGQPLATFIGGEVKPVPMYVSPIPFLEDVEASAERALRFLDDGFTAMKLKIGRSVAVDVAHTRAVIDAVGPDVPVMLDANCGYDTDTAIELARALDGLGVAWLEEPIAPERPEELARIRASTEIPIAAGENDFILPSFEALIAANAVDVIQPNITRVGVSGMLAVDRLCSDNGLALAPHGVGSGIGVSTALHVCCAAKSFMTYEANRLSNPLRDDIPVHPIEIADGCAILSDRPGHGCEIDWAKAERFRVGAKRAPVKEGADVT